MCKLAKYIWNCVVFWKNLHSWQKFYTTAGRDGRDKFQVCSFVHACLLLCFSRMQAHHLDQAIRGGFCCAERVCAIDSILNWRTETKCKFRKYLNNSSPFHKNRRKCPFLSQQRHSWNTTNKEASAPKALIFFAINVRFNSRALWLIKEKINSIYWAPIWGLQANSQCSEHEKSFWWVVHLFEGFMLHRAGFATVWSFNLRIWSHQPTSSRAPL